MSDLGPELPSEDATDDAVGQAVDAFVRALRLSCLAVRRPREAALANAAIAAHVAAHTWAEEAVRRAGRAAAGDTGARA